MPGLFGSVGLRAFGPRPYVVLTGAASLIWCAAFGMAGHALGSNWDSVHHAFRYADYAALMLLIAGAALLMVRSRRSIAT